VPADDSSTLAPSHVFKPLTECSSLFDNHESETMRDNLIYMSTKYSFYVPEVHRLVNPLGLALYLARKVSEDHQCLFCNRIFSSMQAVRQHMVDLGHTMLGTEDPEMFEEIREYYEQGVGEDEGIVLLEDGSLLLPSGCTAVHRDFAYIYRQRLRALPLPTPSRRPLPYMVSKAMLANGGTPLAPKAQKKMVMDYHKAVREQEQARVMNEVRNYRVRNLNTRPQIVELYTHAK
jgi:pre-60S factor REI1